MGLSIDREKVIKELESLRDICNAKSNMAIGNGKVALAGYANAADDAITLLKEQEPKLVRIDEDSVHCPSCGNELFTYPRQRFCDECGQELKWDA